MVKICSVCGSIMDNDLCTNRKCVLHKPPAGSETKLAVKKTVTGSPIKAAKPKSNYDKARRNSKCITYRIEELEKRQENE